jgi:hypothetical protein
MGGLEHKAVAAGFQPAEKQVDGTTRLFCT